MRRSLMLALTVLASGSQANCSALVVDGRRLVLIDAGLSPKATRERLFAAIERRPEDATDLFLTHLDRDHYRDGWNRVLRRHPIRVRLHHRHEAEAMAAGIPEASIDAFDEGCELADGISAVAVRMPHDDRGSTALRFEWTDGSSVARLGYATDLGRVPEALHEVFDDLDILAIESNYDHAMQLASDRPHSLKTRIMNGRGHLSNEQSLTAAARVGRASQLKAIVLLHLSRQCNCPELVRRLWHDRASELAERLFVSSQFAPATTVVATPRIRRAVTREPLLFSTADDA